MNIFLFLSVVPLFLVGGWAWLVRNSNGYPEQRIIGAALWFLLASMVFLLLKSAGWSNIMAIAPVVIVSAAGCFEPEFEKLLSRVFVRKLQEAPPE